MRERVTYRGILFTRYPDSERRHLRVYFWPSRTDCKLGVGALHVEVYKAEVGAIPRGWHVHHKDLDSLNNGPENLEALPPGEHLACHQPNGLGRQDKEHMDRLRELAKAWHGSPEGLAWHSANGRAAWVGRKKQLGGVCFGCGAPITSYYPDRSGRRWCSHACNQRWDYAQGTYDPEKVCPTCGATFRSKNAGRATYCSRSCAARARPRDASGRLESVCRRHS